MNLLKIPNKVLLWGVDFWAFQALRMPVKRIENYFSVVFIINILSMNDLEE